MLQFWKTKEVEPAPPRFDVETERETRRRAVLDADLHLSRSVEALKNFQGNFFALDAQGRLVPRVTVATVSNQALDVEHQKLVRAVSGAHDAFQRALRSWSELT